jgi:hypothetical protein
MIVPAKWSCPFCSFRYKIMFVDVDNPFYRRPAFWFGFWIVILIGTYIYQIWNQESALGLFGVICNALLFMALFSFWLAFYAQFILPVRTLSERSKIIDRLRRHMSRSHGPALFIQNGRVIAKEGEIEKKRAGVIWLDTASAAVTRTLTSYKHTIGPGIHFTDDGEYLAGWLDLHPQAQSIGPRDQDATFAQLNEGAAEDEIRKHKEAQDRRMAVSGLTRDGIEVVPNISVVFKVDAKPAAYGGPGSRFGFDENAVFKAISKEGINPNAREEEARRVAWNQLPALIAADLWREYLSKFTLNQLFEPSQPPLPDIPQPEPTPSREEAPRILPSKVGVLTGLFRYFNHVIEMRLNQNDLEARPVPKETNVSPAKSYQQSDVRLKTALQIITQIIKARMTQGFVPILDASGRLADGNVPSQEFKKLQERGLKVVSVSVSNLRFAPTIEERVIREWNANWLENAQAERERIGRLDVFIREEGRRSAIRDYAEKLSHGFLGKNPANIASAVKALLERSRTEILRDDLLRGRVGNEIDGLEDIIKRAEISEL